MAKKALLGVLERTIGKFVQDLDAEKLNLGIWSGEVVLHDLQLDVAACNAELDRQAAEAPNLAIPVKVTGGTFRNLKLKIPWTQLASKSVILEASGLHVEVTPHDRTQETDFMELQVSSESKRVQHIREQRQQSLEVAELSRIQTNELMKMTALEDDGAMPAVADETQKAGFMAKLVKRIVENIQIDISDIQVSLEGPEGTAGLRLDSISFVTTDMTGHRTFVDRTANYNPNDLLNKFLYKKLKLEGLGIFVEETGAENHNFVLDPMNFEARFREADKSVCDKYPKYLLRSTMPGINLEVSHRQYQQATALVAAVVPSSEERAAKPIFPQYRPLKRVSKETAKEWWHYAYRCVGRMKGNRLWMDFFENFKRRKEYIPLYKRHAHAKEYSWLAPLSKEEEATLREIEENRTISIDGIMAWRNIADARVEKEKKKHEQQEGKVKKTVWSLFGGGRSNQSSDDQPPISLSTDELKELEDVGMEELNFEDELSANSKLCSLQFELNALGVRLTNASNQRMMALEMGRVVTEFDADADGSFQFAYELRSLEISDELHSKSLFPKILRRLKEPPPDDGSESGSEDDVFRFHMSKSKKGDKKLSAKSISFQAVCAPHLLTELVEFTNMPPANQEKLKSLAGSSNVKDASDFYGEYAEYAENLSNALVDAWRQKTQEKTKLSIDMDLQAPILVIPENVTDSQASVLVFDFGACKFRYGTIDPSNKVTKWLEDNPLEDQSSDVSVGSSDSQTDGSVVDYGRLEVEHLTFAVGKAEKLEYMTCIRENAARKHEAVVEPITMRFDFAVESSLKINIPRICAFAEMPASNIQLSPRHVSQILGVYSSWMEALEVFGQNENSSTLGIPANKKQPSSSPVHSSDGTGSATKDVVTLRTEEVNKAVEATLEKKTQLFTTFFVNISSETYSLVLYDSGDFQAELDSKYSKLEAPAPLGSIAEGLVIAGSVNMTAEVATDKSRETLSISSQFEAENFEIYCGFGRNLQVPLQILEPVSGILAVGFTSQGTKTKKIDVKTKAEGAIDINFSMKNYELINAIATDVSGNLSEGLKKGRRETADGTGDKDQVEEIELISSTLEDPDNAETAVKKQEERTLDRSKDSVNSESASSTVIVLNLRLPESNITIINDLQGLDEALFRINLQDLATNSVVALMQDLKDGTRMETTYDTKVRAKFLADYFDSSVNLWKDLLQESWEVTMKAERAPDTKSSSQRFSTKADIHSMPLRLAFSEHFLISLATANHMFTMSEEQQASYNGVDVASDADDPKKSSRHLVSALPYAVDNHSGFDVEFLLTESCRAGNRKCPNGTKKYFRSLPPQGNGHGGKRLYGQDNEMDLPVKVFVGDSIIEIACMNRELRRPKQSHVLDDGTLLMTNVVKEGKSTVLRLASSVSIQNRTPVPINIALFDESENLNAGDCEPTSSLVQDSNPLLVPYDVKDGTLSKLSRRKGIATNCLRRLRKQWENTGTGSLTMKLSPVLNRHSSETMDYHGSFELSADLANLRRAPRNKIRSRFDVVCKSKDSPKNIFVVQASVKIELVNEQKLAAVVCFEPRAQLVNIMPIPITMETRLTQVLTKSSLCKEKQEAACHDLQPGDKMDIFTSGDDFAIKVRCAEKAVRGVSNGTTAQWIQVPLASEAKLEQPIRCIFPFEHDSSSTRVDGNEFYIAEANSSLPDFFLERINEDESKVPSSHITRPSGPKTYLATVGNYGVDHTEQILFEQLLPKSKNKSDTDKKPLPFSVFKPEMRGRCISLLPTAEVPIRIVLPASDKTKRSAYFSVSDVSMSEGGAQATPLMWNDMTPSGFYAYRKLVNAYQSELHIIPEFVIFNGSAEHTVVVTQTDSLDDIKIEPGKTAQVFMETRKNGLPLAFHYPDVGGATRTLRLENLGMHVEMVRSSSSEPFGSLSVQTAIGSKDSRLVIRLGELGQMEKETVYDPINSLPTVSPDDAIRVRVQAEKFVLTLNETIPEEDLESQRADDISQQEIDRRSVFTKMQKSDRHLTGSSSFEETERPVSTIMVQNLLFDVQRLFKEKEQLKDENDIAQRCQVSLIINDFQIRDDAPHSPFPIVFDYTASSRFIDCCVRTKGPLFGRNVKIDLLDMILAQSSVKSPQQVKDKIFVQSSEDFVWKLIDTAAGIAHASEDRSDDYILEFMDYGLAQYIPNYSPDSDAVQHSRPQIACIYNIATAKISPFTIVVSFRRSPHAERYKSTLNTQSAHLMRYFTQQLKFTIDDCKLKFARYEAENLKGPIDRLIEILTAVYVGRIRLKLVAILSAVSFADWKNLASRDDGDDEFVHGDVLRVTGTLAGNSVGYVFSRVGRGLNTGVTKGFGALGGGIENASALVGARDFGASVNTVVSNIGGGVGGGIQGVGEGASHVVKGAGKGAGQLFGGISGGGFQMMKGLGKGIVSADANAIKSGFQDGAKAMGSGFRGTANAFDSGAKKCSDSVAKDTAEGQKKSVKGRRETAARKNPK